MANQDHSVEKAASPTLCAGGCGFYSNVGTAGLCSKCFREQERQDGKMKAATSLVQEALLKAPSASAPAPAPAISLPSTSAPAAIEAPPPAAVPPSPATVAASSGDAPPRPSTTRCLTCNKKVGLTGFACKCHPEAVFCSQHRYAEAHDCKFDYKAAQRQQLAEANPVVQAAKMQRL